MSLQQQDTITVPHTVEVYEKNDKLYLKTFLLDDSVAQNGMGVQPEYIPKHINEFINKPVILTPDFYHPHEFQHYRETGDPIKDLEEYQRLQRPYIVGTITNITGSNLQQAGNGTSYSATLEITDDKAISAFKDGKVPLYVSPSIYRLHNKDPIHSITDYQPLHIAIVDNPAYGFHKANIRAQCQGDKNECGRMLAQAGSVSGSDSLGYYNISGTTITVPTSPIIYCVEKKLGELRNVFSASNSSYSNLSPKMDVELMADTSNEVAQQSVQQEQPKVESLEQKQEQTNKPVIEQALQEQQKQVEEQKRTPINTPIPNTNNSNNNNNKPAEEPAKSESSKEEESPCAQAKADYESKLESLEKDIKAFKEFKANYEKTSAENQVKSKRARIENVVPKEYASSEEERTKAIESLMNVQDEQLDVILNSFVIPATKNVRQAGMQRRKVTDFVKEPQTKNVTQASNSKIDSQGLHNLEQVMSFSYGKNIVPSKNRGTNGGIQ